MPNVEANSKNCQSVVPGNVCAADNLLVKQPSQLKRNEEFASEIHPNIAGNQANGQHSRMISERTAWN